MTQQRGEMQRDGSAAARSSASWPTHWSTRLVVGTVLLLATCRRTEAFALKDSVLTNITWVGSGDARVFQFLDSQPRIVGTVTAADLAIASELDLSHNRLSHVPIELLQSMKAAKTINLSRNPINNFTAGSFAGLTALQEIIVDRTNLSVSLPDDLLKGCSSLVNVTFTHGFLNVTLPQTFSALPNLVRLNLSGNNITKISSNTFANLPKLTHLDLSFNNLSTQIPPELFTVSSSWEFLSFQRNNISSAPKGLSNAVVPGVVSFQSNKWVEVEDSEFANASQIRELNLRSMAIATVNAHAFAGMADLKKLDLSDNVISVMDEQSLEELESLEELLLYDNNLKELSWKSFPPKLKTLRMDLNDIDSLPTFTGTHAPELKLLNLSHNRIWRLDSGSGFEPYPHLAELDLSWNMIENFTSNAFDPLNVTLKSLNLDYNEIRSVPADPLPRLWKRGVNVTIDMNWGIGTTPDVQNRSICPKGSVFKTLDVASTQAMQLYGCIQCSIGTYHDDRLGACRSCQNVSSRAYSALEGATKCEFCPYSADIMQDRESCSRFTCNGMCWLTLLLALLVPLLILFGKIFVLAALKRATSGTLKDQLDEQDARDDWMVEQLIRQARHLVPTSGNEGNMMIFDLPKETQELLLQTLREGFLRRREHHQRARSRDGSTEASDSTQDPNKEEEQWDNLEWENLKMSRILSRNDQGEVFLGEYNGRQVVAKRMKTACFNVQELFDTVREVEQGLDMKHPNLVHHLGTVWTDPDFLCVVSEFVALGDLQALLELESTATTTAAPPTTPSISLDSQSSTDVTQMLLWAPTKLRLMLDVAQALTFLHGTNVFHRDLRSRNVLVTGSFRSKLNDLRRSVDTKRLTTAVHVMETPDVDMLDPDTIEKAVTMPLFAPEILAQREYQASADIYSCGVLMVEMWWHTHLTFADTLKDGKDNPFMLSSMRSDGTDGVTSQHMSSSRSDICLQQDVRLRHFIRSLRNWIEREHDDRMMTGSPILAKLMSKVLRLIEECMQRDPRKRPTASALAVRLEHILSIITADLQTTSDP